MDGHGVLLTNSPSSNPSVKVIDGIQNSVISSLNFNAETIINPWTVRLSVGQHDRCSFIEIDSSQIARKRAN